MDILSVEHKDFSLKIESSKFELMRDKARRNISSDSLMSRYKWSEPIDKLKYRYEEWDATEGQVEADAVFFDNTDYAVWVDFRGEVERASMALYGGHGECFSFYKSKQILSGTINYKNDVGRSYIEINYERKGKKNIFRFEYDVLSVKLDYHAHWRRILEDVENEYRMLALSFLRKTFHGFNPAVDGQKPELVWWNIFQDKQKELLKAVRMIVNQPKKRLRDTQEYLRADKIKRWTPQLENEVAEHKYETGRLYKVPLPQLNQDTVENRFLKYALIQIQKKYDVLCNKILSYKADFIDAGKKMEMLQVKQEIKGLVQHSFFRNIGKFKGLQQENLTLQRATGYAEVYRTWLLLNKAYSLEDGLYKLETKDIATLYEIWCFIEVKKIVEEVLDLKADKTRKVEMKGLFDFELKHGDYSHVVFKKDDIELAELIYNPAKETSESGGEKLKGVSNAESFTVPQRPDIVLQLTKRDVENGLKLTYLFDAKYRLADVDGFDAPPSDAINQMHRYRDAIYYNEVANAPMPKDLKKEIVGGYVLFPGSGDSADVERQKFYESIAQVNIGAFPLRPETNNNSRSLLVEFIRNLIQSSASQLVNEEKVIPQKGFEHKLLNVLDRTKVIVGYVKNNQMPIIEKNNLYYTRLIAEKGAIDISSDLLAAEYVLLHGGKETPKLYKLKKNGVRSMTKEQLKELGFDPKHDIYLAFELYKNPTLKFAGIDVADVKFDTLETKPYTANLVEFLRLHTQK